MLNRVFKALAISCALLFALPAQAAEFRQISQIIDSSGNPVVNGYIYIGTYGTDPVTNPISLFSDSGLVTPIANPVRTDSYGRPLTDIYFAEAQYSYQLKDVNLVSIEGPKDRDSIPAAASVASSQAGTATSCGTFGGSANALTCTLSPAITAYTDLMSVRGRIASDNTTSVTLSINGVGAKNVVKVDGAALMAGDLQQNDTATFTFDTTNNRFQLASPNAAITRNGNNAPARADVASAATVDLDAAATNYVRITGTTGITAITLADGRMRDVVFAGALTITNGASLILPNGANITTAAGDTMTVRGEAAGVVRVVRYNSIATQADMEAATNTAKAAPAGRIVYHPGVAKAWVDFNGTGTPAINASYNVTSITDNGVGDYTINFTTPFSSGNYVGICGAREDSADTVTVHENPAAVPTASAFRIAVIRNDAASAGLDDITSIHCVFFGDQ